MNRLKALVAQVGIFRGFWIFIYWSNKRIEKRFTDKEGN